MCLACLRPSGITAGISCLAHARYKVCWTPETSSEVHAKVAKRLVDCLRRNEGLYVKFGQAMSTMELRLVMIALCSGGFSGMPLYSSSHCIFNVQPAA